MATTLGTMLAISPPAGLIALGVWFVVVLATRYVSLASILGAATLPVAYYLLHPTQTATLVPIVALVVIVVSRHNENIGRLLKGEENRFGSSKSKGDEQAETEAPAAEK